MKTRTKIYTANPTVYVSMGLYRVFAHMRLVPKSHMLIYISSIPNNTDLDIRGSFGKFLAWHHNSRMH